MTDSTKYDVAIIGAGPSGCACALALQGKGLRVVLVDKARFPRDKICGDAIPGDAFKAMDKINPAWGRSMRQFLDISEVRSSLGVIPNGRSFVYHWTNYSYNSKRINFDNFLFQLVRSETNTTIIEGKRLQKINRYDHGADCIFQDGSTLQASLIIGCDGANSVVTRQFGNSAFRDESLVVAVRAYYKEVDGIQKGVNEFYFFKNLMPGYFWIFPLDNGWVNVGFGLLSNKIRKKNKQVNLREILESIIASYPTIAPRFKNAECMVVTKGFALPIGNNRLRISGDRYMLCGDAASLIDPMAGHGIDNAMWSGVFSAEQAVKCFQSARFDHVFMGAYDDKVYSKMGTKFWQGKILRKLEWFYPAIFSVISLILKNERFAKKIIRLLKV